LINIGVAPISSVSLFKYFNLSPKDFEKLFLSFFFNSSKLKKRSALSCEIKSPFISLFKSYVKEKFE
jgi:hypothetical protein